MSRLIEIDPQSKQEPEPKGYEIKHMKLQSYPEPLLDKSLKWFMKIWDTMEPIGHTPC